MEVSGATATNAATATNLQGLLQQQEVQMKSTMNYQTESAQMNMEFQMHKAATDRLNAMAEAIGNTASQASRQLAN
ncbi:MAG TPA: hypothetical protein EYH35_04075 [Thiotrichaceae bacterium]|nr:hypothetical protein [Thiotrichaceae bacterium]